MLPTSDAHSPPTPFSIAARAPPRPAWLHNALSQTRGHCGARSRQACSVRGGVGQLRQTPRSEEELLPSRFRHEAREELARVVREVWAKWPYCRYTGTGGPALATGLSAWILITIRSPETYRKEEVL